MKKMILVLAVFAALCISCTVFGEYDDYNGDTHEGVCGGGSEIAMFSVFALVGTYKLAKVLNNRKAAINEIR